MSLNIARLPLGDLRAALERDGAPPLYYVLLHAWTGVLGTGDVAVRSLSAVLGVGALVACWYAARRSFGTTAAWLTVIVMATNPFLIRYATEARMYMLEMLLVACGIIAVPRAMEKPSWGRLALVALVTCLLVYTQYWAFYLVGVVALALLVVAWRDVRQRRAALLGGGRARRRPAHVHPVAAHVLLAARAHGNALGRSRAARVADRRDLPRVRGR